ncbi:MAG: hypothetical protein II802_00365, partial [Clostridia bacterium]|nr:hypothetical protein [Clostridia bacterium]
IVCIISSAAVIKKPDIPQFQSNDTSSKDEEMLISAAKLSIETVLKNNNINFSEITVCTDKSESGSIIITKVIIYSDSDKQDILNLFESTYKNYEVEIINE